MIVDFIQYCARVCGEICDHMKINLFRIPYAGENLNNGERNGNSLRTQRAKPAKKHH